MSFVAHLQLPGIKPAVLRCHDVNDNPLVSRKAFDVGKIMQSPPQK